MYVCDDFSLTQNVAETEHPLRHDIMHNILQEARAKMTELDWLFLWTTDCRIARQEAKNYITFRVKPQYTSLLYQERRQEDAIFFLASDKHEPWVVIVILDKTGRVLMPSKEQLEWIQLCISRFLHTYHIDVIENTKYSYTDFITRSQEYAHSKHFHVKLHLTPAIFQSIYPPSALHASLLFNFDVTLYNINRPKMTWEETKSAIVNDIVKFSDTSQSVGSDRL